MWNIFTVAVMAIAFLYVFNKTQFIQNRLVAFVPLFMMLLDLTALSAQFVSTPGLFIIIEASRLVVLACCAAAIRRDRCMVAARARERASEKLKMRMAAVQHADNVYEMPMYA